MTRETVQFPIGVKLLDLITGGSKGVYGLPAGRIWNIAGDKSSGKTFICNEVIAAAHYKYGNKFKWMYADCERGYSFDTEKLYGFDIHTVDSDEPETVEDAFYCITKFAESVEEDEFGIYVLDSLDALTSDEQDTLAANRIKAIDENKKFDQGSYQMGKAKYLSREFFPQLCKTLENKNILLIIVSQIRDNVSGFGFEKYTRAGGKALDFYCHMVTWLATAKKIVRKYDGQEAVIGGTNKIKVTKGKVPRPYREGFYTFYFTNGIDNVETGVDYLFNIRTATGEISTEAANNCAWENDPNKLPMESKPVKEWLQENKWYDDYRATLEKGEKFNIKTVLAFVAQDPKKKELFDKTFNLTMSRDAVIDYIYKNNLEEELDRRVEQKWEAFEDSILVDRPGKYAKFYATQPKSTDEDVII